MKVLVRKYPVNCDEKYKDEVFPETSWPSWVKPDGDPLTNEAYRYAMCDKWDETHIDEITADDFIVTEHTREVEDEGGVRTVKYWIATYIGHH